MGGRETHHSLRECIYKQRDESNKEWTGNKDRERYQGALRVDENEKRLVQDELQLLKQSIHIRNVSNQFSATEVPIKPPSYVCASTLGVISTTLEVFSFDNASITNSNGLWLHTRTPYI